MATVIEVRVEYGLTRSVGNYNNVRPSMSLTARLDGDDSADEIIQALVAQARDYVRAEVDNELEINGEQVLYHEGPLYVVKYSDVRRCVVLADASFPLPDERNWRYQDRWSIYDHDTPVKMRYAMARKVFEQALKEYPDYWEAAWEEEYSEMPDIPPLPDVGPEPAWHAKNLGNVLHRMRIDQGLWEQVGELEHATEEYLEEVWQMTPMETTAEEFMEMILSGLDPRSIPNK